MIRGFVILVFYLTTLIAIFFLSAGRLEVWMGWASLGIYIIISLINFFLSDPELVKERSQIRSGINRRDARLAVLSFLFFYPLTLSVAGLDVGRMGWTKSYPLFNQIIALFIYAFGNVVGSWALIPATMGAVGFVIRAAFEDRILIEELVGYQEYATKVQYHLFPGLW